MIDVLKYDKLIKNIAKKYCYNPNDYEVVIKKGEAYMQGIFKEFFLAEEDEVTAERKGGIGPKTSGSLART